MNPTKLLLLGLILLLGGCSRSAVMEKFSDEGKKQIARTYIQRMTEGDKALPGELDGSVSVANPAAVFEQMQAMVPKGAPEVAELVGYQVQKFGSGEATYNLSYQFRHGSKWLLINAAWREFPDGSRKLFGMRVQPLSASLQEINGFTFKNAGPAHYLVFAGVVLVLGFTLVTLVACIRTKVPRRKWLWVLFVLVGFVQFSINWTTGEVGIKPLYFQLFGASAMAMGFGPWMLSFSLPVGAVVFWFRRHKWLAAPAGVAPPPATSP